MKRRKTAAARRERAIDDAKDALDEAIALIEKLPAKYRRDAVQELREYLELHTDELLSTFGQAVAS